MGDLDICGSIFQLDLRALKLGPSGFRKYLRSFPRVEHQDTVLARYPSAAG